MGDEVIESLVIRDFQGEPKPETFLVPQDSRQELWLPLYCFDISCHGKNGCPMTSNSCVVFFDFSQFFSWSTSRCSNCNFWDLVHAPLSLSTERAVQRPHQGVHVRVPPICRGSIGQISTSGPNTVHSWLLCGVQRWAVEGLDHDCFGFISPWNGYLV